MNDYYESTKLDHEKHLLLVSLPSSLTKHTDTRTLFPRILSAIQDPKIADQSTFKDQPLLRLPNELSRHSLKTAQIQIKATQDKVVEAIASGIKSAATASQTGNEAAAATAATAGIDAAITRLQNLKRKLGTLNGGLESLGRQSEARVRHLEDLYSIPGLADVKYETWSRVRLDRLLVDYLLRRGYVESARALAAEKGIAELVDCDAFEACGRIERSLRVERKVEAALAWCAEHRGSLKKMTGNTFEHELRLQQYVELVRAAHAAGSHGGGNWAKRYMEARAHAVKYLSSHPDVEWRSRAATLLAIPPRPAKEEDAMATDDEDLYGGPGANGHDQDDVYQSLYRPERWIFLANMFLETHHNLFGLPQSPLLHMALTAGLSALKTPACHSKYASAHLSPPTPSQPQNKKKGTNANARHRYLSPTSGLNTSQQQATSDPTDGLTSPPLRTDFTSPSPTAAAGQAGPLPSTSPVCPICSTELNKLSKHLPFAHHSKSHVEHDPVALPNGRIYGLQRLKRLNGKSGAEGGLLRDPLEGPDGEGARGWRREELRKVYFS